MRGPSEPSTTSSGGRAGLHPEERARGGGELCERREEYDDDDLDDLDDDLGSLEVEELALLAQDAVADPEQGPGAACS